MACLAIYHNEMTIRTHLLVSKAQMWTPVWPALAMHWWITHRERNPVAIQKPSHVRLRQYHPKHLASNLACCVTNDAFKSRQRATTILPYRKNYCDNWLCFRTNHISLYWTPLLWQRKGEIFQIQKSLKQAEDQTTNKMGIFEGMSENKFNFKNL